MNVLISDLFSNQALARLRSDGRFVIQQCSPKDVSAERLKEVTVLVVRSRLKVDARLLENAPQLKLVTTATSGFDHLDLAALKNTGVQACYSPEANVESAANHTWTLLLALTRQLPAAMTALQRGEWREAVPRGELLAGKRLGLIGLGRVGSRVATIARAFGMSVMAFDPYIEAEHFSRLQVERAGQMEVLLAADVLSFHVPLTRETRRMINQATLPLVNPHAYLINTSRGGVVDENDLAQALDNGILRGAALDVFETEPLPQASKLRQRPNVILSPHLGAYTHEALEAASQQTVDRILEWADGRALAFSLPPKVPWYEESGFSTK
jgi:D-3-phosphoglycerate dehydrogenase